MEYQLSCSPRTRLRPARLRVVGRPGVVTRLVAASLIAVLIGLASACQPSTACAPPCAGASSRAPAVATGQPMGSSGAPPAGAASAAHPSAAPAPVAGAPAPVAQPRAVDRDKLARLVEQARALGTDQLVVWQSGEVLAQFGQDGAPIQSMSITKSVLALA